MKVQAMLITLAAAAFLGPSQGGDKAAQEELKKLEGTWTYVRVDFAGKQLPDALVQGATLTIKGKTYTTRLGGQVSDEGTLTLNPAAKPKAWDKVSNKAKDAKVAGIYELDGDTLKCCEGAGGAERPKDWVSKEGTFQSGSTLKRKK